MHLLNPSIYKAYNQTVLAVHQTPRPFTEQLKQQGKKDLIGAEIGFGHGENAKSLLKELPIKQLYCIDPYINKEYIQADRKITTYHNQQTQANYQKLINDSRITVLPFSSNVAKYMLPKELDFVYIDGDHTLKQVAEDLRNYYPHVKKGGFLGGHDYIFGQQGVIDAVQNFAIKINSAPSIVFPDFWFTKQD